ncbi:VanW family protein [Paenibacillus flagellatus]|uniref:Vancomycin resistance protein n=1 Tax=Paenibacillus flagellatus TaxID=2211139 RepID=A0A2V5KCM2_9BACL|nr:VanW family protein [Paenibacillus flagellatus]PYI57365.1 vancomycin resistance protein [Paenibacillus flagellatus]
MKPIPRSPLRIWLGARYYRLRRYAEWWRSARSYASVRESVPLPCVVFRHSTPIYRRLRDVDMWMQRNKAHNLSIALKRLDGIVVRPGETFSYWRLIGKPTRRKGYLEGMVLFYGTFRSGVGGGLCQLSNLIYWMTLHTPLRVVERHRHSYDVFPDASRTQPFGSGATCSFNYIDLQIHNPTDRPYQLRLVLDETHLSGEWRTDIAPPYRYEIYEKDHAITLEPWGKYVRHNTIGRKAYNAAGECVADEYVTENRAIMMYDPLLREPGD